MVGRKRPESLNMITKMQSPEGNHNQRPERVWVVVGKGSAEARHLVVDTSKGIALISKAFQHVHHRT